MEKQNINTLLTVKNNWIGHTIYWMVAAFLMFFIFSNRNYDVQIRLALVGLLIITSYLISMAVNNYLIPKLLFQGKIKLFIYSLFAVFILTLWLITLSIILILLYSLNYLPEAVTPTREDLLILISGNYLVVILAAVIHFISESYSRMLEKQKVEMQKQETEEKLKEVHLQLLQGQLHPHFLFNMLNNLYGLVKEDTKASREVIIKLSDLLDYMLYECNKNEIELTEEIQFIQNYIELERLRHDEDFNVRFDFPENPGKVKIAPLILFPFVENAFKHGFRNTENNAIHIELKTDEEKLIFRVSNNASESSSDPYLNQENKGIGLKNSRERLNLLYKDKYKLNIEQQNQTYSVHLEITYS
ncbi:MAG: histidine kinase [Bacteroidales bacterium]|nr:histidine kinase [Bacteroidales bacterium]